MRNRNKNFISFLLLTFLCYNSYSQSDLLKDIIQSVSIDSIRKTIIDLQNFQTRYEYSPQQDSAGVYIFNRLNSAGLNVEFEEYAIGQAGFSCFDFLTPSHLWIGGTSGALVYSVDSGENWEYLNTQTSNAINDIEFYNRFIGWIVGSGGLIKKTSDRGNTWVQQNSGTAISLYGISFISSSIGLIVGGNGKILRTTNGGTNWESIISGTNENLYDVQFLNQNNAWAVGNNGKILFSSNSGLSWEFQTPPANSISEYRKVYFIDSLKGWIIVSGNFILKTTDGGKIWERIELNAIYGSDYRGITFSDSLTGFLVEASGNILKTTNGGDSWFHQYLYKGWTVRLNNIISLPNNKLLICGSNGYLLLSSNGGETWFNRTHTLPSQLIHKTNNIVAQLRGTIKPDNEFIFVAHYDSYSYNYETSAPGADDNASGTAAVIEAARILKNYEFESTINFLLVSGEEFGMFGSTFHAFNARANKRNIQCAINADMIGYPIGHIQPRLIVGSYKTYNSMIDSILTYNQKHNLNIFLEPVIDNSGASDYGPFALAGYNALHIAEGTPEEIWGGANPFYHTPMDLYEKLSPNLLLKATQLLTSSIAELAKPLRKLYVEEPLSIIEYKLYQNYPNPFNSETNISFNIPEESYVILKIYDVLGRDLFTLINQNLKPGKYSTRLNLYEFQRYLTPLPSSGVYFYRLEAKSVSNKFYSESKKFLILK